MTDPTNMVRFNFRGPKAHHDAIAEEVAAGETWANAARRVIARGLGLPAQAPHVVLPLADSDEMRRAAGAVIVEKVELPDGWVQSRDTISGKWLASHMGSTGQVWATEEGVFVREPAPAFVILAVMRANGLLGAPVEKK